MFSVIIPTKDEELYLPRLLRSIEAQTLAPTEVIVADAHSTDGTRRIAKEYGAKVVDGGMPSVGRNRGAQAASTDLFVFLDADVVLVDDTFFEQSLAQMREKNLDVATCQPKPLSQRRVDRILFEAYNVYANTWGARLPHAAGFCLFATREIHEKIGGFREDIVFCEDHDYARRAKHQGSFGILSVDIPVSTRRLDKEGRFRLALKYSLAELHLLTLGPITNDKFHYRFGYKK